MFDSTDCRSDVVVLSIVTWRFINAHLASETERGCVKKLALVLGWILASPARPFYVVRIFKARQMHLQTAFPTSYGTGFVSGHILMALHAGTVDVDVDVAGGGRWVC